MTRLGLAALLFTAGAGAQGAAPTVSALEHHVKAYYQGAREALREGASCLQQDHERWLARLRERCKEDACRGAAYMDRLAELHALQPAVTAIRYFTLPRRPELVWIVPPAADSVAAPPHPKAAPARVEGVVLDEMANGDGFVLRTRAGQRYLLVPLMFLEGPTAQRLSLMSGEPDSRFIAQGHLAPAKGAPRSFEPSRCLFIHRAAP